MAHHKDKYDLCKTHMHAYVLAQLHDGTSFDGIITGLDDDYVYFAVPIDNERQMSYMEDYRQFGYGYGYPYAGSGYGLSYPGYGFYGGPRRRFRRLVVPLATLSTVSLLPWY